ncbi:MAG: prepilin-type N-terminal cleavage/methylation domain-containing protein [Parcubacteria group bacterium]|nr:prepilin-type N-terminal cleavage/methylation domain-containing protein [Parcubacteria group bacterium]
MNFLIKIKDNKGVSLIELLVAVTIFTFLILLAVQIFKMVVDGQRSAIAAQNTQENMRYALEKISKEIRMARISNQECESIFFPPATASYKVYNTAAGASQLYFKNKDGVCLAYYLSNNRLKIIAGIGAGARSDFITPAKVEVSNLKFFVVDDIIGAFHSKQPYVTMAMEVKAIGPVLHEQKMKIQMTVSSRYYE